MVVAGNHVLGAQVHEDQQLPTGVLLQEHLVAAGDAVREGSEHGQQQPGEGQRNAPPVDDFHQRAKGRIRMHVFLHQSSSAPVPATECICGCANSAECFGVAGDQQQRPDVWPRNCGTTDRVATPSSSKVAVAQANHSGSWDCPAHRAVFRCRPCMRWLRPRSPRADPAMPVRSIPPRCRRRKHQCWQQNRSC